MVEHREHCRIPVRIDAELRLPDGSWLKGTTVNVSFGGVFMELAEEHDALRSGTQYVLALLLQLNPPITVTLEAEAVRLERRPKGCSAAFRLRQTDLESYEHFKNLIIANADDPDAIIQELARNPGLLITSD